MKKILALGLILGLSIGCSTNEVPEDTVSEIIEGDLVKRSSKANEESSTISFNDTLDFKGYVGDAAVTVQLIIYSSRSYSDFTDSVSGTYSYDAYNSPIVLKGSYSCLDWCNMELREVVKGKSTGLWSLEPNNLAENIKGVWKDPKSGKKAAIVLKNIESSTYLHPEAKTLFATKSAGEAFFKKHDVYKKDMRFKRFYLLANATAENSSYDEFKQYDFPLPMGLRLFFDNAEAYSDGPITVQKNWRIKGVGFDVDYDSLFPKRTEISYEVKTFIFEHVEPTEIYSALYDMRAFHIKMRDIEELGYHLQDEISWLIENSDHVFGFFPQMEGMKLYQAADNKSKVILDFEGAQEGRIAVREAKLVGTDWWGKVEYIYYDQVPCSEEVLIPKPTVTGWIRLYDNEGEITLDHYSRGC